MQYLFPLLVFIHDLMAVVVFLSYDYLPLSQRRVMSLVATPLYIFVLDEKMRVKETNWNAGLCDYFLTKSRRESDSLSSMKIFVNNYRCDNCFIYFHFGREKESIRDKLGRLCDYFLTKSQKKDIRA